MLRIAIAFLILALVAFTLGASGAAGLSLEIGQLLLVVFLVFAGLSFIGSLITGKKPQRLL